MNWTGREFFVLFCFCSVLLLLCLVLFLILLSCPSFSFEGISGFGVPCLFGYPWMMSWFPLVLNDAMTVPLLVFLTLIFFFKKKHMYRDDWIDMLFIVFAE